MQHQLDEESKNDNDQAPSSRSGSFREHFQVPAGLKERASKSYNKYKKEELVRMLEEAEELNVQLSTELEKVQDRLKEKEAFISDFTVRSYNAQQFDINIAPHGSLQQQQEQ